MASKKPKAKAAPKPAPVAPPQPAPVTAPAVQARPPGRPTSYEPRFCEELIAHMKGGYSFESFAGAIGVCRKTIYNWEAEHPEFLHAKSIATELRRFFWEKQGVRAVMGGKCNPAVLIFTLKNALGWRDKVELSGDAENPVKAEIVLTIRDYGAKGDGEA